MVDPATIGLGAKAVAAVAPMTIKALANELARGDTKFPDLDFASLEPEMSEALRVLARDDPSWIKNAFNQVKALASGAPKLFDDTQVRLWIEQPAVQDAVKSAMLALIHGRDADSIAQTVIALEDEAARPALFAAFDYAVAFVARSILRNLTVGERLAQLKFNLIADKLAGLEESTKAAGAATPLQRALLDQAATTAIERLRKRRFFLGDALDHESQALASRLMDGDLSQSADEVRRRGLAWCARWLSRSSARDKAQSFLDEAQRLGGGEEAVVANAMLLGFESDEAGLAALAPIASASRRTAALVIVKAVRGSRAALDWAMAASFTPADFDGEGRLFLLSYAIDADDWSQAYAIAAATTPEDEAEAPAIFQSTAFAKLAQAVAEDQRQILLNGPPFDAAEFVLADGDQALADRREAAAYFERADRVMREFGKPDGARVCAIYALWLRLRDKDTEVAAMADLRARLSDPETAVAVVPLALSFDVPLDRDAVERELNRRDVLEPAGRAETMIARYALLTTLHDPAAALAALEKHRARLKDHLSVNALVGAETRLLLQLKRSDEAADLLNANVDQLDAGLVARARVAMLSDTPQPSTEDLEAWYADNPTTLNLRLLVRRLALRPYSSRLLELGRKLVAASNAIADAEILVQGLVAADQRQAIAEVLVEFEPLIAGSVDLQATQAWSNFQRGDLAAALPQALASKAARNDRNDRALFVNVLIAAGRWPELIGYLEAEWEQRANRTPEQLLELANLALALGSTRAGEFAALAAAAAPEDAAILVRCYSVAVKAGLDGTPAVNGWLANAIERSDESGPIVRGDIRELMGQTDGWRQRSDEIWRKLREGEVPLSLAARALKRPTLALQLVPMLANRQEKDPRRRSVVPAFSGVRNLPDLTGATIALDGSALVTLGVVNLLETTLARPQGIVIPHGTLGWLFDERQQLRFHQPSQIREARALVEDLAARRVFAFTASTSAAPSLIDEVGQDLAEMLASASIVGADQDHPFVVRSSPIHKLASFMEDEADLAGFTSVLVSCHRIIDKLVERGQLLQTEEDSARAFLALQDEKRWPNEPDIPDEATLYLNDISVAHLQSMGLLNRLHTAGFKAFVSARQINEANELLALESRGLAIEDAIEAIRRPLARGIEDGSVRLAPDVGGDVGGEALRAHPNISIVDVAALVDVVVSDERFINRNKMIGEAGKGAPVWTSPDLIERLRRDGALSDAEALARRTELRRCGLVFIMPTREELVALVARAGMKAGALIETAEMRAFRENLEIAQMGGWLHLQTEGGWLQTLQSTLVAAILDQWTQEISDAEAGARSAWLLRLADARNWSCPVEGGDPTPIATFGLALAVNRLLLGSPRAPNGSGETRLDLWLRSEVVEPLRAALPDVHDWQIKHLRELIVSAAYRDETDEEG